MRLPEDKIKQAILDPDGEIRESATRYFAGSYRPDPSIMPIAIKAVETYGRQGAYHLIGLSRDLSQTEETITWVIDELNDKRCGQYENYAYNLSMILVEADPTLLSPKESSIYEARHFLPDLMDALEERLQMMSWDEATCWKNLEQLCEEDKDKEYVNEFNLGRANHIVEALARHGPSCEEKVHSFLTQKIEDYRHNPMAWLEPMAVFLAGRAHLESTIPLIVAKLQEDGGDLLNQASPRHWAVSARPLYWRPSPRRSPGPNITSGSTRPECSNTFIPTWPWRRASTCWAWRRTTIFACSCARPSVSLRARGNRSGADNFSWTALSASRVKDCETIW